MIAKITIEQYRELFGKEYTKGVTFNPFLDSEGNICISEQEIDFCTNKEFEWVKNLEKKEPNEILKNLSKEEWIDEDKKELEKRLLELEQKTKK